MIVKELDSFVNEDKFSIAGNKAEEQMAFYLKHEFYNSNSVWVLNNIRFQWLGDYTQIDHLIIHSYGMIIVESKSVSSKVKFNTHKEWFRLWDNHWEGMRNPVEQAERQSKALKDILNHNKDKLLRKILGKTIVSFDKMPIDCIVAISDKCNGIMRPKNFDYLNVIKADLVCKRIHEIIETHSKPNGVFSIPWGISEQSTKRVIDFLQIIHEVPQNQLSPGQSENDNSRFMPPIEAPIPENNVVSKTPPSIPAKQKNVEEQKIQSLNHCPECQGDVSIRWGNTYKNYYWHCNKCNKNFPINFKCPQCKDKLKIRKQKNEYYIYCEPCKLDALFFTSETK